MNLTANSSFSLDGRNPLEEITSVTTDISEYLDFSFYDWLWYKENTGVGDNELGRWLRVSHRIGSLMSYWVLTNTGRVTSRTTVKRVPHLELLTTKVTQCFREYDTTVDALLYNTKFFIHEHNGVALQDSEDLEC